MNNEIKEILDNLKDIDKTSILKNNDAKILLDYITNLQQENKKLSKQHLATIDKLIETQQRIEKAVKKLEEYDRQYIVVHDVWSDSFILKVIDILNGRSDE